ncbi:MBL fold metallo-hydrolase [Stetteria hydrogenophila]
MGLDVGFADRVRVYVLADDYAGYNSPFLAQHGVSYLVEVWSGGGRLGILFDTGTYADPILFNMERLGVDPSSIDLVVLSHSHYDHTGGLPGILERIGRRGVPIVAHPGIFKVSLAVKPRLESVGIPLSDPRREVEEAGGRWILTRGPLVLGEGAVTTGEVPVGEREPYERSDGLTGVYRLTEEGLEPDRVDDEIALAVNTRSGVVVLSGCSHSGIVSITRKAVRVTGNDRVLAVIGGFHLVNATMERIRRTIEGLDELGVQRVYSGHCTGLQAEAEMLKHFGDRFTKIHAGMVIDLP